jgi:predicted AlkP superfamily pyrophosphatase or phosphodiesterase
VKDKSNIEKVKNLLRKVDGVEMVLDKNEQEKYFLNHERSGDLVCVADKDSWFTYYYWLDDNVAPDFARTVEIHKKPGYDPVELFLDPNISAPFLKVGSILLKKKMGFRYTMNVIPLNADLVKGSHGRIPESKNDWAILISDSQLRNEITATDVFGVLKNALG